MGKVVAPDEHTSVWMLSAAGSGSSQQGNLQAIFRNRAVRLNWGVQLPKFRWFLRKIPYSTKQANFFPRSGNFLPGTGCSLPCAIRPVGTALLPASTFVRAYTANRRSAIEGVIDADSIAACVRELMSEGSFWAGGAAHLLRISIDRRTRAGDSTSGQKIPALWPATCVGCTRLFGRSASILASVVRAEPETESSGFARLSRIPSVPSAASAPMSPTRPPSKSALGAGKFSLPETG
jgi:hypothetical protein